MLWARFSAPTERVGAVQPVDDDEAAGLQVAPAQGQEVDHLVEREVVQLLLGDDHVVGLDVLLEERERLAGLAGEAAPLGVGDLGGVGIDAGDVAVALLVQEVDEVAGAAAHDQDARVPVRRQVRQVVAAVVGGELGVAALDVLGRLPVGIEGLEPRRQTPRGRPLRRRAGPSRHHGLSLLRAHLDLLILFHRRRRHRPTGSI